MHRAGMNVLRINMSHATAESATTAVRKARKIAPDLAVLLDTKGPEIRTGTCNAPIELTLGQQFEVKLGQGTCTNSILFITGANKAKFHVGDEILVSDGMIELKVVKTGRKTLAKVTGPGTLTSKRNANFPGAATTSTKFISNKDKEDLQLARELDVDFVAASFVRNKKDVQSLRSILKNSPIKLISKIEHRQAIDNLQEIVHSSDGIMVARGDLGLSLPIERIAVLQKSIIMRCNIASIPVITATQVIESMINSPRPTRAEATDIANAIFDGTDAIMLSGETAAGKYPVRATEMLVRIARYNEKIPLINRSKIFGKKMSGIQEFISKGAYVATSDLHVDAIVAHTIHGSTARFISRYKPQIPIFAMTPNKHTFRHLTLSYGVIPVMGMHETSSDKLLRSSAKILIKNKMLKSNSKVVVTLGSRVGVLGGTDNLRIQQLKEFI